MVLTNVINPGDKVEFQILNQNSQSEDADFKIYKTSIYDFVSDTDIEISIPTERGRNIDLPEMFRCEMIIYTKKGLYSCVGVLNDLYDTGDINRIAITIKTPLIKLQRREFFRMQCTINMQYYVIDDGLRECYCSDDYKKALQNERYLAKARPGVVVDISGGGIRFVTHEEIPNQDEILVVLALHSEKIDETFYILSEIVDGYQTKGITAKYVNRAKFIFDDLNEREKIVRYVFEMERYMRKKENG